MGITKRLFALLPGNKWCGCDRGVSENKEYQFRVKARKEELDKNLFQVREKVVCTGCDDERVGVLVEEDCKYDPEDSVHERKVGVDEDEMVDYGFQSQDEMARMLIEMRLADSLEPDIEKEKSIYNE